MFVNVLFRVGFCELKMSDVPEEAPEHCPGTQSEVAGKVGACAGCPNQVIFSRCLSACSVLQDRPYG